MIPSGEKIAETKTCAISGQKFVITDKDLEFYDRVSPVFGDKKYLIPTPKLCPSERERRRLAFRNERHLYKRTCDLTGKDIITAYSPDKQLPVYDIKHWESDEWDKFAFFREPDFDRSFFEQFHELKQSFPHASLHVVANENCDFVNYCGYSKDSYLIYNTDYSERCLYCSSIIRSKDCLDCLHGEGLEACYECTDVDHCYNAFYCQNCSDCQNIWYSVDLNACTNCFGCSSLKNKSFHFFNEPLSEAEYNKQLQEFLSDPDRLHSLIQKRAKKVQATRYVKHLNIMNCENVTGDVLRNCKNVHHTFYGFDDENVRHSGTVSNLKDTYDFNIGGYESELCYELVSSGLKLFGCLFGMHHWGSCTQTVYCDFMLNNQNCFGCIGLRKARNCFFNKAYSTQEYDDLCGRMVDHMIASGEWGEFFPHWISGYGYNETLAHEHYLLSKQEVTGHGWNWHEEDEKVFSGDAYQTHPIHQYDERSVDKQLASKNIAECLRSTFACEQSGRPFRVVQKELAFYIENSLPLPTLHPDERHRQRMSLRNPRKLWDRECEMCGTSMSTSYAPDRSEKVLCEQCYRDVVY